MKTYSSLVVIFLAFQLNGFTQNLGSAFPIDPITDDLNGALDQFLFGSGVTVGEISSTPLSSNAIGSFTGGMQYIGMDSGLVICTGPIDNSNYMGVSGDPDLLAVANSVPALIGENFFLNQIYDIAEVSFDFVALGDSLSFDFVFASEEYPSFVNTSFNDVFAFFLAGPGLSGPYAAPAAYPDGAINIAVVPGSDPPLPITVSSVNDEINTEYFIANPSWVMADNPWPSIFGGYTTVLTAHANGLVPGETYHIRLAIGDGQDTALNSIILLSAGSFTSSITAPPSGEGDFNGDGVLNVLDLLVLLVDYECAIDCTADMDGDGVVGISDLLAWLALFD